MTLIPSVAAADLDMPGPGTLVLRDRKLKPASRSTELSVFADDRWDISPGLFEAHVPTSRLNFLAVPDHFRDAAKHYVWQVINHDDPQPRGRTSGRRLALRSVIHLLPRLTAFLYWLDARGIGRIADVTITDLDLYAADVAATEATVRHKGDLLVEVRRLWSYRTRLPAPMRLPPAPPWGGESPSDLLGGVIRPRENRTPRIDPDTMEALLMWCLRFVGDLSDDIITAYHEYFRLWERSAANRSRKRGYGGNRTTAAQAEGQLRAYLRDLQRSGGALPGRTTPSGERDIDWPHLCRLFDLSGNAFQPGSRLRALVDEADLPAGEDAWIDTPITGSLNGRPWRRTAIGYAEAPHLANLLRTACLVVVAYLTGMRTGEVLNLERGCVDYDAVTGLWLINGRHWKPFVISFTWTSIAASICVNGLPDGGGGVNGLPDGAELCSSRLLLY